MLNSFLASIPAPPGNSFSIGPLTLRAYGLMIALGVLVAVELGRRRWTAKGGNPDDVIDIAYRAVPAGLVGARIYHVITDWRAYVDTPIDVFKIWNGGLGIPGGLILGIYVGVRAARKRGINIPSMVDALIPGIPIAQAIGRIGNWWNQEIFGTPTDLPWALEVDRRFRPADYVDFETFHPAFAYEALWNLALAGFILVLDAKNKLKTGQILPLYIMGYGIGRFLLEFVRDDPASLVWGVRVNHWVSGAAAVAGAIWFWNISQRQEIEVASSTQEA